MKEIFLYTCNWGKYITYNDARRLKKKNENNDLLFDR